MSIKAGDWVRRTGKSYSARDMEHGRIYRVARVNGDTIAVDGLSNFNWATSYFELVRKAEEGFRVGDKVRTDSAVPFTIADIRDVHVKDELGNWYYEKDLTLVEPAPITYKFKIGDWVLPARSMEVFPPSQVTEIRPCDGYVRIGTKNPFFLNPDALKRVPSGVDTPRLWCGGVDPAKPGSDMTCVTTLTVKTRRRVVAGTYGILTVYYVGEELRVEFLKSNGTGDELREAAHVLNQIAEVLDDDS